MLVLLHCFRFTELLDSVLHFLLPSWNYTAGSFKDLEVNYDALQFPKLTNSYSHCSTDILSFWTTKTPKQKDFYELYAICKFGAKKYCTSEDKSVFLSVLGDHESEKNKAIDLGVAPFIPQFRSLID